MTCNKPERGGIPVRIEEKACISLRFNLVLVPLPLPRPRKWGDGTVPVGASLLSPSFSARGLS